MNVSNKTQTAIASLVVAVPAGVLAYFVVNSFLGGLEHMPTVFTGLYGATLAGCAGMVFLPFAVLIFGPKSQPKKAQDTSKVEAEPEKTAKEGEAKVEDAFEESTPELDAEGIEEADAAPVSTGELDVVEPTPSEAELDAVDSFDEANVETEAIDAADDDDFDFDDEIESSPKKKK
jgi:hypothetical protein